MEFVWPAGGDSINRVVRKSADAQPTYSEVGAMLRGERPASFRHDHHEITLGTGGEVFVRASTGLRTWKAHRGPGIDVFPHGSPIHSGMTVVVTLGTPWLALAAPCRIVGVIDEPDEWGFAYGTLPGHPEKGEELYLVSVGRDGSVTFRMTAFSRPGECVTRLAGPVGPMLQAAGTNRYLRSLQRFVNESG
jgi:uncharacterized protein (UPF0548 family)